MLCVFVVHQLRMFCVELPHYTIKQDPIMYGVELRMKKVSGVERFPQLVVMLGSVA